MNQFVSLLRQHLWLLLIALVFAALVTGYALGYRPGPGFTIVRAGELVLTGMPKGATVYADETRRAVAKNDTVRIALEPGSHSIIVDAKGDYPWSDVVSIEARTSTNVSPIFVSQHPERTPVANDSQKTAETLLSSYVLPDAQQPLVMEHGCAQVYVLDNRIVATPQTVAGCTPPPYLCVGGTCATTVVFAPTAPLRSVLPYPGRQDALIVSYGNTLAVLEMNPLKPQFFAPLLLGVQPAATLYDATHILVRDARQTFTITL